MFGLEYDLDLFNIVAVDDFNMGGWPRVGRKECQPCDMAAGGAS